MISYPDQLDILLTNLLLQYGLTRDGEDVGTAQTAQAEDSAAPMREDIKVPVSLLIYSTGENCPCISLSSIEVKQRYPSP